jgi:hypothetical protein
VEDLDLGEKRLRTFCKVTLQTLQHMEASGVPIYVVDGQRTPEEV